MENKTTKNKVNGIHFMKEYEGNNNIKIRVTVTSKEVNSKSMDNLKKSDVYKYFTLDNLTTNIQTHSDIVHNISVDDVRTRREGDALVTSLKNVPLMVFTADCVPVVIIDIENNVVGVAHAGWRGTYTEITKNTIELMIREYGTKVENLKCFIGPCIGPCCYEVSEDLYDKFNAKFNNSNDITIKRDSKYYLNLTNVNEYTLVKSGLLKENILSLNMCTNCNSDVLYSYRAHDKTDKRIGTIVEIL